MFKMATVSGKTEICGFDCEFVEKPPEAVQSECPLCLQILCEPHQASCCGNSFCGVCIERIKTDNKPCPTCKEDNFVTFHNKGLQRSLYGFQVYCSQKQEGCEWKGELGQLDNHQKECEIKIINCDFLYVGCEAKLPRDKMPAHLNDNFIIHMSLQAANYNKLLASHKELKGSHATLQASYVQLQISLEETEERNKDSFKQLHDKVELLETENKSLKHQLETTQKQVAMILQKIGEQAAIPPPVASATSSSRVQPQIKQLAGTVVPCNIELVMESYSEYKNDKDFWYSAPFYSHPKGYKFCLRVDAIGNGIAKGTHLSVFTCVIKGEFDAQLKWPFRGRIVVQLVDQKGKNNHHTGAIPYTDSTPDHVASRLTQRERSDPWGIHKFLPLNQLQPNYLKNDKLHFRITKFRFD